MGKVEQEEEEEEEEEERWSQPLLPPRWRMNAPSPSQPGRELEGGEGRTEVGGWS